MRLPLRQLPVTISLVIISVSVCFSQGDGVIDLMNLYNYADQAVPDYITLDETPSENPISNEGATLGRVLFHDTRLSSNNTVSCASCHQQAHAFGDPATASAGVNGTTGRHSMRLINLRFRSSADTAVFWDRRASELETQITQPIQDHVEMGFSGSDGDQDIDALLVKLSDIPEYATLFAFAFGDSKITEERIQQALAQFIRSIQSFDSKYDEGRQQVAVAQADFPNFTVDENAGKQLFLQNTANGGANCRICHSVDNFELDATNTPGGNTAGNNGIITAIGGGTDLTNTRSPNLRDLVDSEGNPHGGFMHDASLTDLRQVIQHYNSIDGSIEGLDPRLGGARPRDTVGPGQELQLNTTEIDQLVDFLNTLTGNDVYTDAKWSDPFDANGQLTLLQVPLSVTDFAYDAGADTAQLAWASSPGKYYTIWFSDDLSNWDPVASGIPAQASGTQTNYGPINNPDQSKGFYRISESSARSGDENILLIILDDWGVDASPLDNTTATANALAYMPNLQSLAQNGLRFTQAYATPTCSPTRAAIMTGRHAHQTGIYVPEAAGSFSADELTLPEVFSAAGAAHSMGLVGKWHLGGGLSGYSTLGGWDEFYGITLGAVSDYENWTKNSNGSNSTSTTYTTTDQVNEALAFINRSETARTPWFCWLAFNAPHSPFHEPPEALAPLGGYSAQATGESDDQWKYRKALEALDTELGRLLEAVDLSATHVILLGDNGTPAAVVQAPFSSDHAKGTLYQGGLRVPMVISGPAVQVTLGSSTDAPVHVVDLFTTILELGGMDAATYASTEVMGQSSSLLPLLSNQDSAERYMISEGNDLPSRGRALIAANYPDYKLIIYGDPEDVTTSASFEFYNIGAPAFDANEQAALDIATLSGTALDAYNACRQLDANMGGGYQAP